MRKEKIRLTAKERAGLEKFCAAGVRDVRLVNRAKVILSLDTSGGRTPDRHEAIAERMRNKIDDAAYRELYSRRMQIIEPVFSNMTYNKGMNRFTLRTQIKVNIQWLLYCIVHNMGKCMRSFELKYD
jgi:hypothetical protein